MIDLKEIDVLKRMARGDGLSPGTSERVLEELERLLAAVAPKCDAPDCTVCIAPELDPATPETRVDADLRALGIDPEALMARGSVIANKVLSRHAAQLQNALNMLCERRAWDMVASACSCERDTAFWCGYHRGDYEARVVTRLTRFLAYVAVREATGNA